MRLREKKFCRHLRVRWVKLNKQGTKGYWKCEKCPWEFLPIAAVNHLRKFYDNDPPLKRTGR